MTRYLGTRLAGGVLALAVASMLTFLTTALVPGNPALILLGPYANAQRIAAITHQMGLDRPLWVRYADWLGQVLHGNLGTSVLSQQPVAHLLAQALPTTVELSAMALLLALLVALPLGLLLAEHADSRWARPLMFLITLGISVPGYWVGLMLIVVAAVKLHAFPPGGYVSFQTDPATNLKDMVLPVVTLAIYLIPPLVRFLRSGAVGVLREDYILAVRAKGIRNWQILIRHVAPNALIPLLTFIGLQIGVLISGAIVTEVIFALPGMGQLGVSAITERDYPVVQGVILVISSTYIIVNLLIDLAYRSIDPRVRVA